MGNVPHRLTRLNAWSPGVELFGEVMESLGQGALLEEVTALNVYNLARLPFTFSVFLCRQDVINQFTFTCCHAALAITDSPSGTIGKNKFHF